MSIHVFDAYGTLLDVAAPIRHLAARVGPKADEINRLLRQKQLEYTWVRTLGHFPWRDFRQLTRDALDFALASHGMSVDAAFKADFVALYDRLEAFPDAAAALGRLKDAGARTAILSNGTKAMLAGACTASGLDRVLDAVVSVDEVARFKTAPQVYALCCERLGCAAGDVTFYSSNRWDVAAARHAGFSTVWVNRAGAPEEYADLAPDRVVRGLAEIG